MKYFTHYKIFRAILVRRFETHQHLKKKPGNRLIARLLYLPAEREGFEPPVPRSTTVFKTAAIDHSAISPRVILLKPDAKVVLYFVFPTI